MNCSLFFAGFLVCFMVSLNGSNGEPTAFSICANTANQCEIHEVRVEPCNAKKKTVCRLKKGNPVRIAFDFTPKFSTDNFYVQPYWTGIPFADMDTNGCSYTTCPLVSGKNATFDYGLELSRKHPKGTFTVEWMVGEKTNDGVEIKCCFQNSIQMY